MNFGGDSFEQKQMQEQMFTPRVGDRVCVMHDGALVKARVSGYDATTGLVGVTFFKGDNIGAFYNRKEVYLLYRYVDAPMGRGLIPLMIEKQNL